MGRLITFVVVLVLVFGLKGCLRIVGDCTPKLVDRQACTAMLSSAGMCERGDVIETYETPWYCD